MMEYINEILVSAFGAGIGTTVVIYLGKTWFKSRLQESIKHEYAVMLEGVKSQLNHQQHNRNEVWLMKQKACLNALDIANAVLSNYSYQNVPTGVIEPQYETTEKVRSCLNELACTCESPEVLNQLKVILYDSVTPDAIVDLRRAVRAELGFNNVDLDADREQAFLAKATCVPKTSDL